MIVQSHKLIILIIIRFDRQMYDYTTIKHIFSSIFYKSYAGKNCA